MVERGSIPAHHPPSTPPSLAVPCFWGPIRRAQLARPLRSHQEDEGSWLTPCSPPSKVGYDRTNKQHHRLLLCLLMTSCDLSDQTKGWKTTRKIAVRSLSHCRGTV